MGLPLWGQLEKAQDDTDTIDTAIADAITEHEADPTAHQGVDESLEAHKSEEVIDHPKSSVLADKLSASDIIFNYSFESLDAFPNSSGLILDFAGQPYFQYEFGVQNNSYVEFSLNSDVGFYDETLTMILAFSAKFVDLSGDLDGDFRYGELRFVIIDDVLSARFYRGVVFTEEDLSAVDVEVLHFYKIVFIPNDDIAYFYVDGAIVASITRPVGSAQTLNVHPEFNFTVDGGVEQFIEFGNVNFSHSVL